MIYQTNADNKILKHNYWEYYKKMMSIQNPFNWFKMTQFFILDYNQLLSQQVLRILEKFSDNLILGSPCLAQFWKTKIFKKKYGFVNF